MLPSYCSLSTDTLCLSLVRGLHPSSHCRQHGFPEDWVFPHRLLALDSKERCMEVGPRGQPQCRFAISSHYRALQLQIALSCSVVSSCRPSASGCIFPGLVSRVSGRSRDFLESYRPNQAICAQFYCQELANVSSQRGMT